MSDLLEPIGLEFSGSIQRDYLRSLSKEELLEQMCSLMSTENARRQALAQQQRRIGELQCALLSEEKARQQALAGQQLRIGELEAERDHLRARLERLEKDVREVHAALLSRKMPASP